MISQGIEPQLSFFLSQFFFAFFFSAYGMERNCFVLNHAQWFFLHSIFLVDFLNVLFYLVNFNTKYLIYQIMFKFFVLKTSWIEMKYRFVGLKRFCYKWGQNLVDPSKSKFIIVTSKPYFYAFLCYFSCCFIVLHWERSQFYSFMMNEGGRKP